LTLRGGVSAENGFSRAKLLHDVDEAMHMADYIAIWLFNRMHALGGSKDSPAQGSPVPMAITVADMAPVQALGPRRRSGIAV
jgi:hypothetical protein